MTLGGFEVTMSKPWKMDRKQTQNHSSPGLLFGYIGDFPGLPFFHQCLMGSLFAFMFSWSFNLQKKLLLAGLCKHHTPCPQFWVCVCASFFPEVVGTPWYECVEAKYKRSLEIRGFKDSVRLHQWIQLVHALPGKSPCPRGTMPIKIKKKLHQWN